MVGNVFFTKSFALLIIAALAAAAGVPKRSVIGMNWGKQGLQFLLPSMVVDLLLENGIHNIKLFTVQDTIFDAIAYTGIEVSVSMSNGVLVTMNDSGDVQLWLRDNIIPYILIGNSPFSSQFPITKNGDYPFARQPLMQGFAQHAIDGYGVGGEIKVTSSHSLDVLKPGAKKPSDGEFRDDVAGPMREVIKQLKAAGAPLMLNVRPMDTLVENNWPVDFGFFDGISGFMVVDGNTAYTNVFDVIYDTFVWAVEKAGGKGVEIIVSQVGWPTDGGEYFNNRNAERFYEGLLKKLAGNIGTPRRPGPLQVFAYNLLDENRLVLPVYRHGNYQSHWGIYMADGHPKFNIDFSGQGRDIYPEIVPGLTYMPERWCVFNGDTSNMTLVEENFQLACNESDCSSLAYAASCSNLDFDGNVSYAFNMYFQNRRARLDEELCDFQGLGMLTTKNASIDQCLFPLQIVSPNLGERVMPGAAAIFTTFSFVFMVLF